MKNLRVLIIIWIVIIFIFNAKQVLYAQNVNTDAKKLYKEAIGLTEIDSYGRSKEKHELGIRKLEETIKLDSNFYEAYVQLAKAYRDYGFVYIGSKIENLEQRNTYIEKAEKAIKKAIYISPNRPEAYHIYLLLLEDYETNVKRKGINLITEEKAEMERVKKKLYEIDPNNPEVMYRRGYDLIEEGKVKEGIPLVLKGIRGDTGLVWSQKERLTETLKKKGYNKEAEEIIAGIQKEKKYYEGMSEIRYKDIDKGIKVIKESVDGDLNKLEEWQKKSLADELERKQRYKEAADVYELIDPKKYKDYIKRLRDKANVQEDFKKRSR